jgi:hypothetical protein
MSEIKYIGKLDGALISAATPFIVRLADGQTLDFTTFDDAVGFLRFYNKSPRALKQNPAAVYALQDCVWKEKLYTPSIEPSSHSKVLRAIDVATRTVPSASLR